MELSREIRYKKKKTGKKRGVCPILGTHHAQPQQKKKNKLGKVVNFNNENVPAGYKKWEGKVRPEKRSIG